MRGRGTLEGRTHGREGHMGGRNTLEGGTHGRKGHMGESDYCYTELNFKHIKLPSSILLLIHYNCYTFHMSTTHKLITTLTIQAVLCNAVYAQICNIVISIWYLGCAIGALFKTGFAPSCPLMDSHMPPVPPKIHVNRWRICRAPFENYFEPWSWLQLS